jgi:assimilatory nitrate reductase catalytic subunit
MLAPRTGLGAGWLRLDDTAAGRHHAIRLADGSLQAALFLTSPGPLPPRDWLVAAFAPGAAPPRLALLAGTLPGAPAGSPTVCVCHGVDAATIRAAAAAGIPIAAGTGCGSCKPEIRALLATARVKEPA